MLVNQPNNPHPMLGVALGQYRIDDVIGGGGMGVVFRAYQETVDRHVALKLLPPELAGDATNVLRLEREAKALARLNHPNVVTTFDFGLTPSGQAYLVMELVNGKSLEEVLKETTILDSDRALRIFIQIAEAMRFAHEQGIVHRDLKPHNVMLSTVPMKDFVKVLDFGIVKVAQDSQQLTQIGDVMGSPLYMSPEQCTGKAVDLRTDIYSLGVLMYQCLTGKFPFQGINLPDTVQKKCKDPIPTFESMAPDLIFPNGLEDIVRRTLQVEPSKRYQTMAHLKEALELLLQTIAADSASMFRPGYAPAASTLASPPAGSTSTLRDDPVRIGGPLDAVFGGARESDSRDVSSGNATASDAARVTITTPLLITIIGVVAFALATGMFLGLNASGAFSGVLKLASPNITDTDTTTQTRLEQKSSRVDSPQGAGSTESDRDQATHDATSKVTDVPQGTNEATEAEKPMTSAVARTEPSAKRSFTDKNYSDQVGARESTKRKVESASAPPAVKKVESHGMPDTATEPPFAPPLSEQLKKLDEPTSEPAVEVTQPEPTGVGSAPAGGPRRIRPRALIRRVNQIQRQTGQTKGEVLMDIIERHRDYEH